MHCIRLAPRVRVYARAHDALITHCVITTKPEILQCGIMWMSVIIIPQLHRADVNWQATFKCAVILSLILIYNAIINLGSVHNRYN